MANTKIPRVQKGLLVWMVTQSDGLICPDLWGFTRRRAREKAVRTKGKSWRQLSTEGWASNRAYIATIPSGFKLDICLRTIR